MTPQRWRRFLPDRSQLWILLAAVVAVVAGAGFINLASARSSALAEQRAAQAQLEQVTEQNRRLHDALAQTERGDNVEVRARQYFGFAYPGETKVVAEPAPAVATPAAPAAVQEGGQPYWLAWWKRFVNP